MATLTSQERVARTLARTNPDRIPIYDQFWFEVQAEWREQIGKPFPPGFYWGNCNPWSHKNGTLWEYFDMDILQVGWPDYMLRIIAPETLEETDEWVIQRDGNWATLKWWKHKMGTPEHFAYGIDSPQRWQEVKHLLTPDPSRVRWDEFWPLYRRAREQKRFVCYGTVEVIEMIKDVLGHEIMLAAMITDPDWIHDVFDHYTNVAIKLFEITEAAGMTCDGAFVYGDMAYKNGPFMSPAHYREFVKPYHTRLFNAFKSRGMPVLFHSDGDIRLVIDDLIEAGVDSLNPLENNAHMDVRELAPQCGNRVGFCGNIAVKVLLTNDREQVKEEICSKLAAAMPYRGYIYHSDHSIPPGVRLDTFRYAIELAKEYGRYD
jgi:uroporphyrinogen decarboxylase